MGKPIEPRILAVRGRKKCRCSGHLAGGKTEALAIAVVSQKIWTFIFRHARCLTACIWETVAKLGRGWSSAAGISPSRSGSDQPCSVMSSRNVRYWRTSGNRLGAGEFGASRYSPTSSGSPCHHHVQGLGREASPRASIRDSTKTMWPINHNPPPAFNAVERAIATDRTNQLDRLRGWEAESGMRVASLEYVLTAATLVSAIVVVLWGIKIFYGAWTDGKLTSNRDLRPRRGSRHRHHFRGGGSLLFLLPATAFAGRSPRSDTHRIW